MARSDVLSFLIGSFYLITKAASSLHPFHQKATILVLLIDRPNVFRRGGELITKTACRNVGTDNRELSCGEHSLQATWYRLYACHWHCFSLAYFVGNQD